MTKLPSKPGSSLMSETSNKPSTAQARGKEPIASSNELI